MEALPGGGMNRYGALPSFPPIICPFGDKAGMQRFATLDHFRDGAGQQDQNFELQQLPFGAVAAPMDQRVPVTLRPVVIVGFDRYRNHFATQADRHQSVSSFVVGGPFFDRVAHTEGWSEIEGQGSVSA